MSEPTDPEQVLARPLPDDDLTGELGKAKVGVSKVTLGLGVGVLVLAAFGGGVWTHSAFGSTTSASAPAAGRAGGGGFRGGAGTDGGTPPSGVPGNRGNGNGTGFGRGTIGTVDHVDGTTIYVKTQDGKVVKVSTSDTTKVELSKEGAVADLAAGNQVVVVGQAGDDGTVAAQTVTQRAATG
ncbi:hypothetical protein [Umezawaea sp. Da 62-37]|uniref:hypothetical protein n=1 Tax=Umezawaea sp. Da 62-37 TaxID=3075927 RepID=UPI0028F71B30|nr:hypothetical protein [Umezawaea sp. Da 62-37]WNV83955.1 hypothetical protein RM788_38195 [Umezawaea sp. Da 62-37]